MTLLVRRLLALAAVAVFAGACAGTPGTSTETSEKARAGLAAARLHAGPGVVFEGFATLPASVHNSSAEVTTTEARLRVRSGLPLGDLGYLGLAGSYEYRNYSFHELGDRFGDDDPVDDFRTLELDGTWVGLLGDDIQEDWGIIARLGIRSSVESGADLVDGITGLGLVIFGRQIHPKLRIGVGVGMATRLDDDPIVIPAVGIDWEIAEWLRARVIGPGLEVVAKIDDERTLALVANYDFRTFRLDGDGPGADGILEDDRIPVVLRFTQSIGEASRIRVFAGADVFRRLEVLDEDGDRVDRVSLEPAALFGLAIDLGF